MRLLELRWSGKERLKIFEKDRDEFQRSSEEDGKLMKRFQAILECRQRFIESFLKDFQRSSEVDQGRWKEDGKISDDILKSAGEDGKCRKDFRRSLYIGIGRWKYEEKISDEFVTNEGSRLIINDLYNYFSYISF